MPMVTNKDYYSGSSNSTYLDSRFVKKGPKKGKSSTIKFGDDGLINSGATEQV